MHINPSKLPVDRSLESKPNLVWCPVGARDFIPDLAGDRNFDVILVDYGDGDENLDKLASQGVRFFSFENRGVHKWPSVYEFLPMVGWYSHFLFLDDDIVCDTKGINRLFDAASFLRAPLSQAALSEDSKTAWGYLREQPNDSTDPCKPREVPMVEIMMPCFSGEAVTTLYDTFCLSESGWGLDKLWPKVLDERLAGEQKCYVFDDIVFGHPGRVESAGWKLSGGMTPFEEMRLVPQRYRELKAHYRETRGDEDAWEKSAPLP